MIAVINVPVMCGLDMIGPSAKIAPVTAHPLAPLTESPTQQPAPACQAWEVQRLFGNRMARWLQTRKLIRAYTTHRLTQPKLRPDWHGTVHVHAKLSKEICGKNTGDHDSHKAKCKGALQPMLILQLQSVVTALINAGDEPYARPTSEKILT